MHPIKAQAANDRHESPDKDLEQRLRDLVAQIEQNNADKRLPDERRLAQQFGVTRARLRKSLEVLEAERRLWRGVGRGTFVGPRPVQRPDVVSLAAQSNPAQVMRARMAIEPELAGLAAVNATDEEVAQLKATSQRCKEAADWREYEFYDAQLHHEIAISAHNAVLLALIDLLTQVRRSVTWGRPRPEGVRPPASHHSFRDHDRIIDAIAHREPIPAANAMRQHLQTVEDRLMGRIP
jgi:DNA-binding FadR family transcriptional regulator